MTDQVTICPCGGHGGQSRGTAILGGPDEADWALMMSRSVDSEINGATRPGLRSVQLRLYDQSIGLDDRGEMALANNATLALSIHVNNGPLSLHGMSCFVWPGDELGLLAAKAIIAARPPELIGTCQSIVVVSMERGHWTRDARAVLWPHASRGLSACLAECAFARPDREHLLRIKTQDQIAAAITAGALAVYEEVYHGRPSDDRCSTQRRAEAREDDGRDAGRRDRDR